MPEQAKPTEPPWTEEEAFRHFDHLSQPVLAAERDRLKAVNAELVECLEICLWPGKFEGHTTRAELRARARDAIARAKAPATSSCYVHGDHDGERCPECAKVLEGG